MPDRENVVKYLQKAKMVIETWVPMFEQYNTLAGIDDALELLKAQEPRVLTLDEVRALPVESDVWVEITGAKGSKPRITATTIHGNGEREIFGWLHTFNFAAYGKEIYGWRCWASRPTEEQRKAVAWE